MNENIALWIIAICLVMQTAISLRSSILAKTSLQKLENLRSRNPEHQAIRKAMANGQYDEALKMALNFQQKNPGDPYSWYYAGTCYYNMKAWDKAVAQLKEAQRMSPIWEEKWTGPYLRAIEKQTNKEEK
jgi:tetratricopeptide (TPR) repeat protein